MWVVTRLGLRLNFIDPKLGKLFNMQPSVSVNFGKDKIIIEKLRFGVDHKMKIKVSSA